MSETSETSAGGRVWEFTFRRCDECSALVEDGRYLEHTAWHAETHRPVDERLLDAWSEGYGEGYADGVAGHRTD